MTPDSAALTEVSSRPSSWYRFGLVILLIWILVSILSAGQVYLGQRAGAFPSSPVMPLVMMHLLDWLPWVLMTPLILGAGRRFRFDRTTWPGALAFHLPVSLLITALKLGFDNLLVFWAEGVPVLQWRFVQNYAVGVGLSFHTQVLVYWVILSTGYAIEYYRRYRQSAGRAMDLGRRLAVGKQRPPAQAAYPEGLVVKSAGKVLLVRTEEIEWIEAADYYAQIHANGSTHLLREPIKRLESRLDPASFVRIHRSAIVNIRCVDRLERLRTGDHVVVLRSGRRLRMSRSRRGAVQRSLHSLQ